MGKRENLRNVAIIAHVDHGKTTLVDQLLRQSGVFRSNEAVTERVMDSGDLERERGITILSKNTAVMYNDIKINIVDTPGHADFGGEVERILMMVDGVLLLVDAFEGCMPQTRFVLKKALGLGKKPVVVVNKVDRPGARPLEVVDEVLDLFIELGADEDQLDFPVVYASARDGYAMNQPDEKGTDMKPLFEAIINDVPAPEGDLDGPTQVLFSNIDYDEYVGRIGIGRVERGSVKVGQTVTICSSTSDEKRNARITKLYQFEGLKRVDAESAELGDIVAVSGMADLNIGETACDPEHVEPLPFVKIDEPTVSMMFMVNNSPFAGREGKYVTSRHIKERLDRELEKNLALRVEPGASSDSFVVYGRGVLHLSVLIETMRREGYELQVGQPKVIIKQIDGQKCEPVEELTIDIPEEYSGRAIELVTKRKGTMTDMTTVHDRQRIVFDIPSRGIIGLRSNLLTATAGEAVMSHRLKGFEPYKGDMEMRQNGSLIAMETGTAYAYAINKLQDRGTFFVSPQDEIYAGQVVGESTRSEDIVINLTKSKKLTNMRASGSDDKVSIAPPVIFSLEEALEYIKEDEYVEVTPKSIRLRKIILDETMRKRQAK